MEKEIKIAFRKPIFPVIFIDNNNLDSFQNIKDLCLKLYDYNDEDNELLIIDSSAEEFCYHIKDNSYILAPGFLMKRWSKKEIVELFNESIKGKNKPFNKNFSNIKLSDLIKEICIKIKNDI